VNELLEKLKKALADGVEGDELAAIWAEIATAATTSAGALDAALAEKKTAEDATTTAIKERDALKTQLDASGSGKDEAVAALQEQLATAKGQVSDMKAADKVRQLKAKALRALKEAKIPEERRGAALQLLDLTGVSVGDDGALVGATAKIEALKKEHAFLWEGGTKKGGGDGGKRGDDDGAKDDPRNKKDERTQAQKNTALGTKFAENAFARNRGKKKKKKDDDAA
jgi:hypothetical protein